MAHPTRFERVTFAFGGTLDQASSKGPETILLHNPVYDQRVTTNLLRHQRKRINRNDSYEIRNCDARCVDL